MQISLPPVNQANRKDASEPNKMGYEVQWNSYAELRITVPLRLKPLGNLCAGLLFDEASGMDRDLEGQRLLGAFSGAV
jgi:hypothetical protein